MNNKMKRWMNESGAIMLEVVAVLSLMGLMGTMLFRQIYLRNQELHNIQMASEIRLVKEAFAAWIQASDAAVRRLCRLPENTNEVHVCDLTDDTALKQIANFLPEGYLSESSEDSLDQEMSASYDFFLTAYYRGVGTGSEMPTYYGVVVPKIDILPDRGEETST